MMKEDDLENEKEWRRLIYADVQEIKREVSNLRGRIIGIISIFGSIFGALGNMVIDYLRHR